MEILMITGSPHKDGTSNVLACEFIRGAEEAGHTVYRFDSAFEDVSPCRGCDSCRAHGGKCIYSDSMDKIYDKIISSDMIVFVSPLYYFGLSAQIKTVIDRFYSINYEIMGSGKKSVLLATAADGYDWTMSALELNYDNIVRYLGFEDKGKILATYCYLKGDILNSSYPDEAYELGKSL